MCAYRKPASKASPAPVVSIGVTGNARLYTRSIPAASKALAPSAPCLRMTMPCCIVALKLATASATSSVWAIWAKFCSVGKEEIELGDHGSQLLDHAELLHPSPGPLTRSCPPSACNYSGVRRLQRGEETGYVKVFCRVSAQNGRKIRRANWPFEPGDKCSVDRKG